VAVWLFGCLKCRPDHLPSTTPSLRTQWSHPGLLHAWTGALRSQWRSLCWWPQHFIEVLRCPNTPGP